jgi:predicted nucleotidyltransferase
MRSASGTFVLRIPPDLHERLREVAAHHGKSLNALCRDILQDAVGSGAERAGPPARRKAGSSPLERLTEGCRRTFGSDLVGLALFGSVARGEEFPDSDLDLLLVMIDSRPIRRELYTQWEKDVAAVAAAHFTREVTPHFAHLPARQEEAGGLWLEVALDATVLWERDRELSDALRAIRAYSASGGATRRIRHGHPYWVRERSGGR